MCPVHITNGLRRIDGAAVLRAKINEVRPGRIDDIAEPYVVLRSAAIAKSRLWIRDLCVANDDVWALGKRSGRRVAVIEDIVANIDVRGYSKCR